MSESIQSLQACKPWSQVNAFVYTLRYYIEKTTKKKSHKPTESKMTLAYNTFENETYTTTE